jgi:hypothetical protein
MNLKEIFEKERFVALYQDPKHGHVYVATHWGERDAGMHMNDICLSKPQRVCFKQIPHDEMIQGAVAALDAAATQVRLDMQRQLDEIAERKQQLLAITFRLEVVP